jgi:hypothetical protein
MLKVQKIFQNSHRQKTAASGGSGSPEAYFRLLRTGGLNFSALENRISAGRNLSRLAF